MRYFGGKQRISKPLSIFLNSQLKENQTFVDLFCGSCNIISKIDDNYYEIEGEEMNLDKDILVKHNKIYSPETCVFVPHKINKLFVKGDKVRGKSVIGTSLFKNGKYRVDCNLFNPETGKSRLEYLGLYDTQEKGFEVYKYYKERNIKQVADYYKGQIPQKLYDALYKYEVEIKKKK